MKEIGGYIGLEQLISNEYHKDLISLNSGRNALLYILKAKKIEKLYIPYYICDSITDMLDIYKYNYEYYRIDSDFMPIFNKQLPQNEYLYIVNFYGQLTNETISGLNKKNGQIIMDYSHAFFQKPIFGIDIIYTCRKFFGVPDGAYLSTTTKLNMKIDLDFSMHRMTHLLGRYEGSAADFYNHYQNNEESFKNEPLKHMSNLTHNLLGAIDYENAQKIRDRNYAYLEKEFSNRNKLNLIIPNGAFAYPLYVENGIEIRKALAQKKIYIPTLWSNVINTTSAESIENKYAANILPLPCDQRYEIEDMKYILKEVKTCIN